MESVGFHPLYLTSNKVSLSLNILHNVILRIRCSLLMYGKGFSRETEPILFILHITY